VVASRREVPELVRDADIRFERHRRAHPVRHRGAARVVSSQPRIGSPRRARS
jgi:hypothetical protein